MLKHFLKPTGNVCHLIKNQYLCTRNFANSNYILIFNNNESIRNRFHFDSRFV